MRKRKEKYCGVSSHDLWAVSRVMASSGSSKPTIELFQFASADLSPLALGVVLAKYIAQYGVQRCEK